MQTENKYIGDDKFIKMLEHYKCETPLGVIKMRFAGAICSPNLQLRPTDVISSFWPHGHSPRLETKEEADLFFKFFMGLWDEIFQKVKQNKITLPPLSIKEVDLKMACAKRFAEVELGFVEGFWGGQPDLKLPVYLAEVIDSLSDIGNVYARLEKKLDSSANLSEIKSTLEQTDTMAEKTISFIIENAVLPRIESLQRSVN